MLASPCPLGACNSAWGKEPDRRDDLRARLSAASQNYGDASFVVRPELVEDCVHIANAIIAKAVASVCRRHGLECPVICTPEELLGECAMAKDYIVDEVRRIREDQAARHSFDLKAILAAAKKRQRTSGFKVVSFVAKKKLTA